MGSLSLPRQKTFLLIIAVLMVVVAWWILFFPRTTRYRNAKNEAVVKERLKRIQSPPGARLVQLRTSHQQGWPEATADYLIDSDCAALKDYYKREFERQGFAFGDEYRSLQSATEADSLLYSDHDYSVGLSCSSADKQPRSYMIILTLDTRVNKETPLPNPVPGASR